MITPVPAAFIIQREGLQTVGIHHLGITLVHEHIVYGYPGWEGDLSMVPLDHEAIVNTGLAVFEKLKPWGVRTFVDATAIDGGRMPEIYREISERSGTRIYWVDDRLN